MDNMSEVIERFIEYPMELPIEQEKVKRFVELHRRIIEEVGLREALFLNGMIFGSKLTARLFFYLITTKSEITKKEIAEKLKISYTYTPNILHRLRSLGIIKVVKSEKRGRGKIYVWRLVE